MSEIISIANPLPPFEAPRETYQEQARQISIRAGRFLKHIKQIENSKIDPSLKDQLKTLQESIVKIRTEHEKYGASFRDKTDASIRNTNAGVIASVSDELNKLYSDEIELYKQWKATDALTAPLLEEWIKDATSIEDGVHRLETPSK